MKAETWVQIRALFPRARVLAGDARRRFVETSCGEDRELRAELERLLERDALPDPGLDGVRPSAALPAFAPRLEAGQLVGGFRLLSPLGSGGMGVVWLAEQEAPRRRVALKTLRPGLLDAAARARFLYEAEVLGRLSHPGIAQIHASGLAPLGWGEAGEELPWFAMEFVEDARPILAHAEERALDLRARLALFGQVCAAIQHGHERGVVHRDVKPANVLVGASGAVKVIDFGIARAVDPTARGEALATRSGELLGTLQYMAPEQVAGDPARIGSRCDVHALGLLLYELLTGAPAQPIEGLPLADAVRRIQSELPPPPSRRRSGLPRELDWIAARALAKEPELRYASPAELAADVARFLRDEPVLAAPPGAAYRLRKLVARHRAAFAAGAVALSALVIGLAVALDGWREAVDARERTVEEAAHGREVLDTLTHALTSVYETRAGGPGSAIELLERVEAGLDGAFSGRPRVEAELRHVLARAYEGAGREAEALALAERAHVLWPVDADSNDLLPRRIAQTYGDLLVRAGRADEAHALLAPLHASNDARLGPAHPVARASLYALAQAEIARGGAAPAEAHLRLLLEHLEHAEDEAAAAQRASASITLGQVLSAAGRLDEAIRALESTPADLSAAGGADAARGLGLALQSLADAYGRKGSLDRALELTRQALAVQTEWLARDHPHRLTTLQNLGLLLLNGKRPGEAEVALREALELFVRSQPELGEAGLQCWASLARAWRMQGRAAEAAGMYAALLESASSGPWAHAAVVAAARGSYGFCLYRLGRFEEAERELAAAEAGLSADPASPPEIARAARQNLYELYRDWGRPREATAALCRLQETRLPR